MSNIEWTEKTWNPIVGCTVVSPGCTNCYAMKMAGRLEAIGGAPHYNGTTQKTRGGSVWTGKMALSEKAIIEPLKRKKPTMYFVNSMGDLFHENVPDEWIDRVFAVMALCPQHTFQVLTKRSTRMREYMSNPNMPALVGRMASYLTDRDGKTWDRCEDYVRRTLSNVWLGVSAEDQARADERIPNLLRTPAAVRFVSAEPLLGPIDWKRWLASGRKARRLDGSEFIAPHFYMCRCDECGWVGSSELCGTDHFGDDSDVYCPECHSSGADSELPGIDWVIVGGESGPGARPMHPDWARSIRDQCGEAGTAFFMKQMSGVRKSSMPQIPDDLLIRETPQ